MNETRKVGKLESWKVAVVLLALAPFLFAGCKKDKDDSAEQLYWLLLFGEITNPSFKGSCFTGTGICGNFYRAAPNGCTGATSISRCTPTSAFGACTELTGGEFVYYPGNTTCTSVTACASKCTGTFSGTWNPNYTGQ